MKRNIILSLITLVTVLVSFTSCSKSDIRNGIYTCNVAIYGMVTNTNGEPINGVRIYSYRINKDNSKTLIGTSTTNASGEYSISKNGLEVILGDITIEFSGNDTYNEISFTNSISSMDYSEGDNDYFVGHASVEQNIELIAKN